MVLNPYSTGGDSRVLKRIYQIIRVRAVASGNVDGHASLRTSGLGVSDSRYLFGPTTNSDVKMSEFTRFMHVSTLLPNLMYNLSPRVEPQNLLTSSQQDNMGSTLSLFMKFAPLLGHFKYLWVVRITLREIDLYNGDS